MSRYSLIFDTDFNIEAHSLAGATIESISPSCQHSRYNIGRNQDILVFCSAPAAVEPAVDAAVSARTMRWGFIPHWIHSPNPALQPLTVADTKITQPYFRDAFQQRRCLIPASGFYAWQGWENGPAAPYYVRMRDQQAFFMAGIWDSCEGVDRVAMITTGANSLLRPIHDRMPAIIGRAYIDAWLHGDSPQQWLVPHSAAAMEIYQVGRKLFSQDNDSADMIAPVVSVAPAAVVNA